MASNCFFNSIPYLLLRQTPGPLLSRSSRMALVACWLFRFVQLIGLFAGLFQMSIPKAMVSAVSMFLEPLVGWIYDLPCMWALVSGWA